MTSALWRAFLTDAEFMRDFQNFVWWLSSYHQRPGLVIQLLYYQFIQRGDVRKLIQRIFCFLTKKLPILHRLLSLLEKSQSSPVHPWQSSQLEIRKSGGWWLNSMKVFPINRPIEKTELIDRYWWFLGRSFLPTHYCMIEHHPNDRISNCIIISVFNRWKKKTCLWHWLKMLPV